ncbi:hypothetical protein LIER_24248 [Lithospermum erythrorhizon]|uniref:Uncharacterized protein n=1 Tax=Lithospermum erythrorhizon TaxID=34254 RepID=A0AAV3R456_LITER
MWLRLWRVGLMMKTYEETRKTWMLSLLNPCRFDLHQPTNESPQVHLTHSASQPAGVAQAVENVDKPGDPPTIIQDSLPVAFSYESLVNFRQYFSIPSFIEICLPLEGEKVLEPLVDPTQSDGASAPGWTAISALLGG